MRAPWLGVLACCLLTEGARADGQLEDPEIARRVGPPPAKRGETVQTRAPFLMRAAEVGALSGRTVYVSAGHGWIWDASLGRWRTQRGNTHDLVEDFISAETIAQHLIPLLHDMGAYVVPVREADMSPEMVVVDDGAATVDAAAAVEADGFALAALPLTGATNPFDGGGSRVVAAGGEPRVVATWDLTFTDDAEGNVYLSWVQGADRAPDAHYVIHHAGGSAHVRVDQRRHGSTWVLIGQYHFAAGDPPERRRIELLGDSSAPGAVLSIDAVRVGGGGSRIDRGMGTSGRPAFEDGARYAAQWNGAPSTVWDYAAEDGNDDVGTRSRFAAWEHEAGEDAVYVAWHTNAPSPARGTSSFAYGPSAFGPLSEFSGVPGSLELMDAIHRELIADLRAAWEPAWQDRQQHTAYFGEVNPSHNPEMPATLIEVAFHDTAADADALREPAFRHLAARAMAQGIARYFAARDGASVTLPPGTPTRVQAVAGVTGGMLMAWSPPADDPAGGDAPAGYTVYLSPDGRAFDDGHDVDGTDVFFDPAALNGAKFARVVARNAGGRSRPSPVVGGWSGGTTDGDVLVVAGFTRLDGAMLFREDLSSRGLGTLDRAYENRINDGSHGGRIGLALHDASYGFQIASVDAVRAGVVDLAEARAVIWLGGEEPAPLTLEDRELLRQYTANGGAVIYTGTDLARQLSVDAPDTLPFHSASFVADDAESYALTGDGELAGESFTFDDDGVGGYDADAPDVLGLHDSDGRALLSYAPGQAAAVVRNTEGRRVAFTGFPIETVRGRAARARVVEGLLRALGVDPERPDDNGLGTDEPGGCCGASGNSAHLGVAAAVLAVLTRRRRVMNMRPS